jgi:serine/threonine-protein kinase
MELNPSYATARQRHAWYLLAMGRLDEALAEMKRAQELDPLSRIINTNVGTFLYYQRRYDEALAQFRKVGELDQSFRLNHVWPGWAYAAKGAFPEAIAEFQHEQAPWEQSVWGLGYSYARSGQRDAAREILIRLGALARQRYVSPSAFILIHTALGEKDRAFSWLENACEARDFDLCLLKVDPKLDSLRADQRFPTILRRVRLAP